MDELYNAIAAAAVLATTAATAATCVYAGQALGMADIPRIIASGPDGFNKTYKGRLFTEKMIVNFIRDKSPDFVAVGFSTDLEHVHEIGSNVFCSQYDMSDLGPAVDDGRRE